MAFLFGKPPTIKELTRAWKSKLTGEQRNLERTIKNIDLEEKKCIKSLKDAASKGKPGIARILAKELVRSRRTKERLYASKAQLNSVSMQISEQQAMMKVAGAIQKSTGIMSMMNGLMKVPEVAQVMREMSKEMTKAGLIEEMMSDAIDGTDPADMEEETERAVDKILFEITQGQLGAAPNVPTGPVGVDTRTQLQESPEPAQQPGDEDLDAMRARLQALKSL